MSLHSLTITFSSSVFFKLKQQSQEITHQHKNLYELRQKWARKWTFPHGISDVKRPSGIATQTNYYSILNVK